MIGCLRTRVRKQPITELYFEFETVLMFYNLEARNNKGAIASEAAKKRRLVSGFVVLMIRSNRKRFSQDVLRWPLTHTV